MNKRGFKIGDRVFNESTQEEGVILDFCRFMADDWAEVQLSQNRTTKFPLRNIEKMAEVEVVEVKGEDEI